METYGKILLIAMPAFLLLVLLEKWYGWYKGKETVRTLDMISSLSSGVTNVTKDVLGLSLVVISYEWMVEQLAITQVPNGFLTYLIAFIALDFECLTCSNIPIFARRPICIKIIPCDGFISSTLKSNTATVCSRV